jgi:chromosome segregation ATPase
MEMEDLLISTGVDSLIRLVKERGKVELLMASELLGLPQATVEDWAHILEEEGIIKIDYQLTKVYFVWVPPTAEEIETKKQVFHKRKDQLESDISKLEGIQETGKKELQAYSDVLDKISDKFSKDFEKIDKLSAQIETARGTKEEVSRASLEKMEGFNSKLDDMEESLKELESQLKGASRDFGKSGAPGKMGSISNSKEHIAELGSKLDALAKRVEKLGGSAPAGKVDVGSVKSDFNKMRKDFSRVRKESETLGSMISEFKANADMIKEALPHIKQLSAGAARAKKELKVEYAKLEALKKELPALEKHIKDDLEVADQYAETINIAHEVLNKVPSKGEIIKRMAALEKEESRMATEFKTMESLLSGVEGSVLSIGDLFEELEAMKDEIEEAREQLSADAEEVLTSIEEETSTYATFQKIKAKAKASIDAYLAQLAKIRKESTQIKKELEEAEKAGRDRAKELSEAVSPETAKEALELVEQLRKKREELRKIRKLISDLHSRSSMIEKNVKLLSKEAKLIALREGSGKGAAKRGPKSGKLKEKAALTTEEQHEFERKRKELKSLIRKLWESD